LGPSSAPGPPSEIGAGLESARPSIAGRSTVPITHRVGPKGPALASSDSVESEDPSDHSTGSSSKSILSWLNLHRTSLTRPVVTNFTVLYARSVGTVPRASPRPLRGEQERGGLLACLRSAPAESPARPARLRTRGIRAFRSDGPGRHRPPQRLPLPGCRSSRGHRRRWPAPSRSKSATAAPSRGRRRARAGGGGSGAVGRPRGSARPGQPHVEHPPLLFQSARRRQ